MRMLGILLVCAVGLAACAAPSFELAGPERQTVGEFYSVEPQIAWNKLPDDKRELWTVDGPSLEQLRFFKGLSNGETLFEAQGDTELPKFQSEMTASEVSEFVVDTLSRVGWTNVEPADLRPTNFGERDGFRFELTLKSEQGLEYQGLVTGTVAEERLHLIAYMGTRAHYFPKYKEHVERLIASINMAPQPS